MTESEAVSALAALAHPQRLRAFRALVVAGPQGSTPSTLADQLDVATQHPVLPSERTGPCRPGDDRAQGRNLVYRADFARMNDLLGYMTEHCCQGEACEVVAAAPRCTAC